MAKQTPKQTSIPAVAPAPPSPDPATRVRTVPIDRNGLALKIGDAVLIAAVVKSVDPYDDGDNLAVDLVEPIFPTTTIRALSLNSRQVQKA